MKAHVSDIEAIQVSDIIETMTWNRQRSTEELLSFINGHHQRLEDVELGV